MKEIYFEPKDFIFNNGLVNFALFLKKHNFGGVSSELERRGLKLEVDKDDRFYEIFEAFIKEYKIVHQTKNKRWYFDENRMDFVYDYRFDTKGGQKNDLRNGVYLYKRVDELGLSREEARRLYEDFCVRTGLTPEGEDKVPNKKNELIVAITLDEAIRRFARYMVKGDKMPIDSKIHTFEDGQDSFHDMLRSPKNYEVDKWEALVYWFGGRTGRYYYLGSLNTFIYPNAANLVALYEFKKRIKIGENPVEITDDEGNRKELPTNIDFYHQLKKDGVVNPNFYISRFPQELELKFFLYLFSVIYHIEDEYYKSDEFRKQLRQKLFLAIQEMSFVMYAEESELKSALNEYTKAYKLMRFFEGLKERKIYHGDQIRDLFWYLTHFLTILAMARGSKEYNKELRDIVEAILEFRDFRKPLFFISYVILQKERSGFGRELWEFVDYCIKTNLKGVGMDLHKDAKTVGEGIGLFCANTENKDLLFRLRNVKNFKQLVSFFKDLKFEVLRHPDEAKFSKEFEEALERILQNEKDWELARDYIAIYAIDKYRSAMYAKNQSKE